MTTNARQRPALQPARHLLLLVAPATRRSGRARRSWTLRPLALYGVAATVSATDTVVESYRAEPTVPSLTELLVAGRGDWRQLTIWLPRGWLDLSLSGLATLMELGQLTYRSLVLDGERLVLTGRLCGQSVRITSFAAYCGGSLPDILLAPVTAELTAISPPTAAALPTGLHDTVMRWLHLLWCPRLFELPGAPLTVGSAARGLWRSWFGPARPAPAPVASGPGSAATGPGRLVHYPLTRRPPTARAAERQACYGLFSEQYRRGLVPGPVYCWDAKAAYLQALCRAPLPMYYLHYLSKPPVSGLAPLLADQWALALVRVGRPQVPCPYRSGFRTGRAEGTFWTWLAGAELARAVAADEITECYGVHVYGAATLQPALCRQCLTIRDRLLRDGQALYAAYWRGLYSALVGQFAQREYVWEDRHHPAPSGDWSTWRQWDAELEADVKWRCVAGRTQRLLRRPDNGHGFPAIFAAVTAWLRSAIDATVLALPPGCVLARVCDSLWLTQAGHEALATWSQRRQRWPIVMSEREVYDTVWLTGDGRAVVAIAGEEYVRSPGVPAASAAGEGGLVEWPTTEPWTARSRAPARQEARVGVATCSAAGIKKLAGTGQHIVRPWPHIPAGLLREELLVYPPDPSLERVPAR